MSTIHLYKFSFQLLSQTSNEMLLYFCTYFYILLCPWHFLCLYYKPFIYKTSYTLLVKFLWFVCLVKHRSPGTDSETVNRSFTVGLYIILISQSMKDITRSGIVLHSVWIYVMVIIPEQVKADKYLLPQT